MQRDNQSVYFSDRSGLEDPSRIEALQEPVLEALKHYVRSRRKDHPQVFASMLMKLTDLRSISVKGLYMKCILKKLSFQWCPTQIGLL